MKAMLRRLAIIEHAASDLDVGCFSCNTDPQISGISSVPRLVGQPNLDRDSTAILPSIQGHTSQKISKFDEAREMHYIL